MSRDDLGRQLSEEVEVKTPVHQAWLKNQLEKQGYFQVAKKKDRFKFNFSFMNFKKLAPSLGIALALVLVVTIGWSLMAPLFHQQLGVIDVQAQELVDSALKKIQYVNNLSPEQERQALEQRIKSGLRSVEDTTTTLSMNITANSMFKTIYTEEQMIGALKRINHDMESALKEARAARDLSLLPADTAYQDIGSDEKLTQQVQSIVCAYGSFKVQNFGYINNFDYAGGEITQRIAHPGRCDDVTMSDVFTESASYPLLNLFANEGTSRPNILRYTDPQGRITFLVMSAKDGLPLSVMKPLLTDAQTTEVMKSNLQFFTERMQERFTNEWSLTSDVITPEEAQKQLLNLRMGTCQIKGSGEGIPLEWNLIGVDAAQTRLAQHTFDTNYFTQRAVKVVRYYHDTSDLSVNNCSGKYIIYAWYDKDNNPLLVAVRKQVEF